ncbi:hypothetical protein L218DRAFT_870421, partial [Marasmius fiardii PR-910]
MPGTRKTVLQLLHKWKDSECQTHPVCWLSGAAGVGKSAIALSIAKEWETNGLVSSFFFFRSDPKRNNPDSLILSIAHGLIVTRPYLRDSIYQRITSDPHILDAELENQYKELVLKNLNHSSSSPGSTTPDLVVIDGLDECCDDTTQQKILTLIFSTYHQSFHLPLRFLLCSRPESWIRDFFECQDFSSLTKHIDLDDSRWSEVEDDITRYFEAQFQNICKDPKYKKVPFPDPWHSPGVIWLLVWKADGQFIYAATIIKFVRTRFSVPTTQLDLIV